MQQKLFAFDGAELDWRVGGGGGAAMDANRRELVGSGAAVSVVSEVSDFLLETVLTFGGFALGKCFQGKITDFTD